MNNKNLHINSEFYKTINLASIFQVHNLIISQIQFLKILVFFTQKYEENTQNFNTFPRDSNNDSEKYVLNSIIFIRECTSHPD